MKRYEFVEHTADIAARIYGGSLNELFTSAALAMYAVMVKKKQNKPQASLTDVVIEKTEETLEDLLKAWLDELLFYFSSRKLLLHRIKALECDETSLRSRVLLASFDSDSHEMCREIKAVTYNELKVEKVRDGWQAFVIFDV